MNGEQALAQLRHLYAQMVCGEVYDAKQTAHGLLGPAIAALEGERSHIAALEKERDAALADNAALVTKMHAAGEALHRGGYVDLTTGGEHSGAALLEEHRKALEAEEVRLGNVLARLSEEVEHFSGKPCAAALSSILSGIERVVVRARNEGLEKAAERCETIGQAFTTFRNGSRRCARSIRAMKEPESV